MLIKYKPLIVAVAIGYSALALAQTPQPTPQPSKDAREKMAQAHEKMAACLRSNREMADCHKELMQTCKETMGENGCGMGMGMMGGHHGRQMQQPAPATKTK